ncbi:MAG TPA: hypothetical protein VFE90_12935 [Myxococcales bacterium]|jgi:hypothetical protein|nr:hypothetical protein [Myxococcales bacterium]
MNRRLAPRLALGLAFVAGLSACIVNLSFDMDQRDVAVQAPVAGSASQSILVDLGKYKEITDHKDSIRSLDLDYADITVTKVNAGNQATKLNGTFSLRKGLLDPAANDVKVGDLVNFPATLGSTVRIKGTPALDAFLLQQLQSGGTFYVVMNGTVDGKTDIVLDINMHASIGYDSGIL